MKRFICLVLILMMTCVSGCVCASAEETQGAAKILYNGKTYTALTLLKTYMGRADFEGCTLETNDPFLAGFTNSEDGSVFLNCDKADEKLTTLQRTGDSQIILEAIILIPTGEVVEFDKESWSLPLETYISGLKDNKYTGFIALFRPREAPNYGYALVTSSRNDHGLSLETALEGIDVAKIATVDVNDDEETDIKDPTFEDVVAFQSKYCIPLTVDMSVFDMSIQSYDSLPEEGLELEDTKGYDKALVRTGYSMTEGELLYLVSYQKLIGDRYKDIVTIHYVGQGTEDTDSLVCVAEGCTLYDYDSHGHEIAQEKYEIVSGEFVLSSYVYLAFEYDGNGDSWTGYKEILSRNDQEFYAIDKEYDFDDAICSIYKEYLIGQTQLYGLSLISVAYFPKDEGKDMEFYDLWYSTGSNTLLYCRDGYGTIYEDFDPTTLPHWNEMMSVQ